jgi:tRNA pseudouridine55 synthase
LDDILNINKPAGKTSFSIVALVKRRSGERRAGHAGTLDPAATGVLPVCLGRATRLIEFLVNDTKTYLARIEFGVATDTYDGEGRITQRGDPSGLSREKLEEALTPFRGAIRQTPPMYSALKHHGRPLYALAREGIEVERPSRPAHIHRLELTDWQPPVATVEVTCGKGTYIRSLAHDLGQALGCGAHLKNLVRTRCGCLGIETAVALPQLEEAFRYGYWTEFVLPMDTVLQPYPAVVVDTATEAVIKNGGAIALETAAGAIEAGPDGYCRAYTADGYLLAMLQHLPGGLWQPKKVLLQE